MLAGIPDLMLPQRSGAYSGLFIEMKQKDNRPTTTQADMLLALRQNNYAAFWCDSFEDAQHLIVNYLKGKIDDNRNTLP